MIGWQRSKKLRRVIDASVTYLLLTAGAVVFLIPFFWMVTSALKTDQQILSYPIHWIPAPVIWDTFIRVWQAVTFGKFFANSLFVTVFVIVGRLLACTVVAFGFARKQFFGRNVLFLILLGTLMIPFQVTIIPLFIIFHKLHWINTYAPLIVPEFFAADAFSVFLLRQFFMTIPMDLDESATLDGASSFQIFRRIILPLSKPALVTVVIFGFMNTWNDFFRPLIYLNSPDKFTLPLGLQLFRGEYAIQWNLLMAASIEVILPCLVLFFFTQRYFVEGIALTGIKT